MPHRHEHRHRWLTTHGQPTDGCKDTCCTTPAVEQCERAGCDNDDDTSWGLCSECQTADNEEDRDA